MANATGNVLILTGRFEVRGSTVQSLALIQGLVHHGYQVRVVCPDASVIPAEKRAGFTIFERPALDWPFVWPMVWRWLERDLAAQIPDVIHAQHRRMLPLAKWLSLRWKRPVILSVHDYLRAGESLPCEGPWLSKTIAVSESVRKELLGRARLAPDHVQVIHSGVATPECETPAVLDPEHAPVVGTAGPLEAAKGLTYFLAAAPAVLREHPHTQFLIAGAGPEERNLRQQARALEVVDRVTFVPNFSDFSTSLSAMDIYVLPSLKQGLGTIMLEAMSRGLPVIATSSGGVYSVVSDGHTGILVPPSDSASLAKRIIELLRDPIRARTIGENAKAMVARDFPVARMISETIATYRNVTESARKSAAY